MRIYKKNAHISLQFCTESRLICVSVKVYSSWTCPTRVHLSKEDLLYKLIELYFRLNKDIQACLIVFNIIPSMNTNLHCHQGPLAQKTKTSD